MIELRDLGSVIDLLYGRREERLNFERKVKELKAEEMKLREEILDTLAISGLEKASGHLATAGVKTSIIPITTEWSEVHNWIRVNDRFDLLQKRLSVLAWRELYDSGITIPGTEAVEDVDLSLTKSSRS